MKEKIWSILIAILYFFRQAVYYINTSNGYFLVGNLDAFYIFAPVYIVKQIKKIKKKDINFILICITYLIIQVVLLPELNIQRAIINVSKIIVCYLVMQCIKEYYHRIDLKLVCKIFSILCIIFLILSITFSDSILWRHNDYINKYDLNRLKFLYTEPSELGLHAILVMIIYMYMIVNSKNIKTMVLYTVCTLPIIAVLFLAKPLGAIGIGAISIAILCLVDFIFNYSKKKLVFYMILLIIVIMILGYMIANENSLYLRVMDTFKGKDTSNNYRIFIPFRVCGKILEDTWGIGIGFGNAELKSNVEKYKDLGLQEVGIVSSYINIISESGIFGIVMVSIIIIKLLKKSFKEKSVIKIALTIFIILYQFMGTHFTNPLCWILYGMILSDIKLDKILANDIHRKVVMKEKIVKNKID